MSYNLQVEKLNTLNETVTEARKELEKASIIRNELFQKLELATQEESRRQEALITAKKNFNWCIDYENSKNKH